MNDKEYEEFKEKVREARKNRLYVSWRNSRGLDCKTVGPSSMCFCGHRYKMHAFDNVTDRNIFCNVKKCPCPLFVYIPVCKRRPPSLFSHSLQTALRT